MKDVQLKSRKTFTRDNASANIQNAADRGEARRRPAMLFEKPALVVSAAINLIAALCLYAALFANGTAALAARVASGDTVALCLAIAGTAAGLVSGIALEVLLLSRKQEAVAKSVDGFKEMLQTVKVDLFESLEKIDRHMPSAYKAGWRSRRNIAKEWSGLLANSVFTSINGVCRFDVTLVRDSKGHSKVEIDPKRIAPLIDRFAGSTRLREVNHIVVDNGDGVSAAHCIRMQLAAYRALRQMCVSGQIDLDMTSVRFHLTDARHPTTESLFIGEFAGVDRGRSKPFARRYSDFSNVAGMPSSFLDRDVLTTFDPDIVQDMKNLAAQLISRSGKCLTLVEAELQFGDQVPEILPFQQPFTIGSSLTDDVLDFGDGSFRIS